MDNQGEFLSELVFALLYRGFIAIKYPYAPSHQNHHFHEKGNVKLPLESLDCNFLIGGDSCKEAY
jgi:hypothetical protein